MFENRLKNGHFTGSSKCSLSDFRFVADDEDEDLLGVTGSHISVARKKSKKSVVYICSAVPENLIYLIMIKLKSSAYLLSPQPLVV